MVQRVDVLGQVAVAAEVGCERVSLNRANVRDVPDNLLEFVLELDLTVILQVLGERNVNEACDSDLKSDLV